MADRSRDVVLVTGGAGYIGSHAVKVLRRAGYAVVVFDNLSAGHREATLGAPLIEGDIRDTAAVRAALRETGARAVMHFAARLIPSESVQDPAGYYHNNVTGALATLEAMAAERCQAFVFSSTCAVYGEPREVPLVETQPTAPITPYGQTKLVVEQALPYFERAYGLRSVCLRYFNAAGADPDGELGEDHTPEVHLIPRAIEAVRGGEPLQLFGEDYPTPDGTCLRDYVHVTDLADAHLRALERLLSGRESAIYNVGTECPSSVRQVLAAVERVAGAAVPYVPVARRPGDPSALFASAARIRSELGWRPERPALDTIVRDAWRWHSAHPHGFRVPVR